MPLVGPAIFSSYSTILICGQDYSLGHKKAHVSLLRSHIRRKGTSVWSNSLFLLWDDKWVDALNHLSICLTRIVWVASGVHQKQNYFVRRSILSSWPLFFIFSLSSTLRTCYPWDWEKRPIILGLIDKLCKKAGLKTRVSWIGIDEENESTSLTTWGASNGHEFPSRYNLFSS